MFCKSNGGRLVLPPKKHAQARAATKKNPEERRTCGRWRYFTVIRHPTPIACCTHVSNQETEGRIRSECAALSTSSVWKSVGCVTMDMDVVRRWMSGWLCSFFCFWGTSLNLSFYPLLQPWRDIIQAPNLHIYTRNNKKTHLITRYSSVSIIPRQSSSYSVNAHHRRDQPHHQRYTSSEYYDHRCPPQWHIISRAFGSSSSLYSEIYNQYDTHQQSKEEEDGSSYVERTGINRPPLISRSAREEQLPQQLLLQHTIVTASSSPISFHQQHDDNGDNGGSSNEDATNANTISELDAIISMSKQGLDETFSFVWISFLIIVFRAPGNMHCTTSNNHHLLHNYVFQ